MKKNISGFKHVLCQPSVIPRATRAATLKNPSEGLCGKMATTETIVS
jgi:hypothetical protein